ncbi:MAG: phosphoribosylglycinamide synthetase C domain-containing protein, partial [Candidatus Ratteibacteria bacterium]
YLGLMITEKGPYVLEYNVRFGDPETEVILPRMSSDLLEVLDAATEKLLNKTSIKWKTNSAVDVVIASGGYPGKYSIGYPIKGLDSISKDVVIFHAGTKKENDIFLTAGGRVLNVVGLGNTIAQARTKAYEKVDTIFFKDMYYRKDIASVPK